MENEAQYGDFNPEMLIMAMQLRGLGVFELAEKMGIHPGDVSKWSHGLNMPDDNDVTALSVALRFPPRFFYRTGRRYAPDFPLCRHQSRY